MLPVERTPCPQGSDAVVCLDKQNASNLMQDVLALQAYADEAFTRCGPVKE
jgi:hypothetical protein